MEDNLNPIPEIPQQPPMPDYTARGWEFIFGGIILLLSIFMINSVLYGGFNLGFALAAAAAICCSWLYVRKSGHPFGWYEKTLLIFSLVIAAGFGRSADGFVKFVMVLFLFVAVNLALGIAAGQNRRDPNGALCLLDAPRVFYRLGLGGLGASGSGIAAGFRQGGETTRKFGAVGIGLLVSAPILIVLVILLMSADAAFEGLMDLLPEVDVQEYFQSILWGTLLGWILYSRGVILARGRKPVRALESSGMINPLTVNTVLCMVCLVYVVYLVSQLAYLSGGLSGILPEEFTMAEYARRGFFEMAWLCAINLAILCGVMWLIRAQDRLPPLTRIAGCFLGCVTIFLVVTASAKMFLYIGSYGLTRLRVLTEVIMLWLAVTTVLITIRLFVRRMPYMKAVMLTAMVLGTVVFWVDVNSFVADYNMNAYRTGKLDTMDVSHMGQLGAPGIGYLIELTEDDNPEVAAMAQDLLSHKSYEIDDFRGWNHDTARAAKLLLEYHREENAQIHQLLQQMLGLDTTAGSVIKTGGCNYRLEDGLRFLQVKFSGEAAVQFREQLDAAGWKALPLRGVFRGLLQDKNCLFGRYQQYCQTALNGTGYWFFLDLHPQAKDSSGDALHSQEGYRCVLAFYDPDTGRLYYLEADRLD